MKYHDLSAIRYAEVQSLISVFMYLQQCVDSGNAEQGLEAAIMLSKKADSIAKILQTIIDNDNQQKD